jgi:hypothetical protein
MTDVSGRRNFRPRSRGLIGHMLSVPIHSTSWKRCGRTNSRLLPYRHVCRGRTSLSRTVSLGRRDDHIVLLHVLLFVQREEHHGKLLVAFSRIRGPYRCGVPEVCVCRTQGKNMEFELELPFFENLRISVPSFSCFKRDTDCVRNERFGSSMPASICSFEHEKDAKERLLHALPHLRFCRAPHVAIEVFFSKTWGDHGIVSLALSDFVSSGKRRSPCRLAFRVLCSNSEAEKHRELGFDIDVRKPKGE